MFCLQCPRAAHAHRLDQFVHSLCRGYFSTISACSIFCMALTYQKNHFNKMLRHLNVACAHICGSKVTKSARVQKCRLGNFSCFPMDLKVATILGNFGPSGVRALPLAAGRNEGIFLGIFLFFFWGYRYSKPQKGLS